MQKKASTNRIDRYKKKKSKKKFLIALAVFLSITSVVGTGFIFVKYYYNNSKHTKIYREKEKSLLEAIQSNASKENDLKEIANRKMKNQQILLYLQKNSEKSPLIDQMNQELQTFSQQLASKCSKKIPNKLVGRISRNQCSKQVADYQIIVDEYVWNNEQEDWDESSQKYPKQFFARVKDNHSITLEDIFQDTPNLLAVQQILKQKILDKTLTPENEEETINAILNMPNISFKQTKFIYSPTEITFDLRDSKVGIDEMTIAYDEISPFLNKEFIAAPAAEASAKLDSRKLDSSKKYVALTFDDGPNPATTSKILSILKEKGVFATFFMLGENVEKNEDLAKLVQSEGHEIASHSYSHPQLTTIEPEEVKDEDKRTDKAIYHATGQLPVYFRPPYGSIDKEISKLLNKPIIQWSVDSEDWKSKNTSAIVKQVKTTTYDNSIILMHDIHQATANALAQVIDELQKQNYEIVPVSTLLENEATPLREYYGHGDSQAV